jgi:hypothetical protein
MPRMITYSTKSEGIDWVALKQSLADDAFDNGRSPSQMERSFRNSYACVYARDGNVVIGTGRAISDGVCNAYIVDMWTQSAYRRRGVGQRMMKLLCASLSGQHVYLFTDDLEPFYGRCGFAERGTGMEKVVGEWLNGTSKVLAAGEPS